MIWSLGALWDINPGFDPRSVLALVRRATAKFSFA